MSAWPLTHRPSLYPIDAQMPDMCGYEVIQHYRQWERVTRPRHRPLRVYACTGNATSVDAAAHVAAGFDGTVSKPIYPQVFRSLLSDNMARVQGALVQGSTHRM